MMSFISRTQTNTDNSSKPAAPPKISVASIKRIFYEDTAPAFHDMLAHRSSISQYGFNCTNRDPVQANQDRLQTKQQHAETVVHAIKDHVIDVKLSIYEQDRTILTAQDCKLLLDPLHNHIFTLSFTL